MYDNEKELTLPIFHLSPIGNCNGYLSSADLDRLAAEKDDGLV